MDGVNSFSKIQTALPNITHQMLGRQVKQLEQDGLVIKIEKDERLKRIDYHLTAKAKTLEPIIRNLCEWGKINIPACIKASKMGDAAIYLRNDLFFYFPAVAISF